jgi:hypothetical protein
MYCGHAGHLDEFFFWRKKIEKRRFDYAKNSYRDEFSDLPPRSFSCALPHTSSRALSWFSHGPNHRSYVLVRERMTLCLDALIMAHILIVVIISYVCPVFLLEGLTLTLSRDTWMVQVFPIIAHVSLSQMVRCKGL